MIELEQSLGRNQEGVIATAVREEFNETAAPTHVVSVQNRVQPIDHQIQESFPKYQPLDESENQELINLVDDKKFEESGNDQADEKNSEKQKTKAFDFRDKAESFDEIVTGKPEMGNGLESLNIEEIIDEYNPAKKFVTEVQRLIKKNEMVKLPMEESQNDVIKMRNLERYL